MATYPTIKLTLRLILLTIALMSELIHATWDEVDFEAKLWIIPNQRMKARNPHVVHLSRQAFGFSATLHACAAGSRLVFPLHSGSGCVTAKLCHD